jgi:hypothetical protein
VILVWLLTISLAGWFGFELGRKWDAGRVEEELEEYEKAEAARGGIRLNRITVRR